jgi:hypothetical protein
MPETYEMRDGTKVEDPRLGRLFHQDERSRDYPVSLVVPADIKPRTFACPRTFDQDGRGTCVPHGGTHDLVAYPAASTVPGTKADWASARRWIEAWMVECQRADPWPGEYPAYDGTSVLAVGQTGKTRGYWSEYRWAFSVEDMLRALSAVGPIIVGTAWLQGMFTPRPSGLLEITGSNAGGHCYLIRGWRSTPPPGETRKGPYFRCRQSWYRGWSKVKDADGSLNGDFFVACEDYEQYLLPGGDQLVPVGRRKVAVS